MNAIMRVWDAHVRATISHLTSHPADRGYGQPGYSGRHQRRAPGMTELAGRFTLTSAQARAALDAQRADAAVLVLAATDDLPASRVAYRELLRAGALSCGLDVAS